MSCQIILINKNMSSVNLPSLLQQQRAYSYDKSIYLNDHTQNFLKQIQDVYDFPDEQTFKALKQEEEIKSITSSVDQFFQKESLSHNIMKPQALQDQLNETKANLTAQLAQCIQYNKVLDQKQDILQTDYQSLQKYLKELNPKLRMEHAVQIFMDTLYLELEKVQKKIESLSNSTNLKCWIQEHQCSTTLDHLFETLKSIELLIFKAAILIHRFREYTDKSKFRQFPLRATLADMDLSEDSSISALIRLNLLDYFAHQRYGSLEKLVFSDNSEKIDFTCFESQPVQKTYLEYPSIELFNLLAKNSDQIDIREENSIETLKKKQICLLLRVTGIDKSSFQENIIKIKIIRQSKPKDSKEKLTEQLYEQVELNQSDQNWIFTTMDFFKLLQEDTLIVFSVYKRFQIPPKNEQNLRLVIANLISVSLISLSELIRQSQLTNLKFGHYLITQLKFYKVTEDFKKELNEDAFKLMTKLFEKERRPDHQSVFDQLTTNQVELCFLDQLEDRKVTHKLYNCEIIRPIGYFDQDFHKNQSKLGVQMRKEDMKILQKPINLIKIRFSNLLIRSREECSYCLINVGLQNQEAAKAKIISENNSEWIKMSFTKKFFQANLYGRGISDYECVINFQNGQLDLQRVNLVISVFKVAVIGNTQQKSDFQKVESFLLPIFMVKNQNKLSNERCELTISQVEVISTDYTLDKTGIQSETSNPILQIRKEILEFLNKISKKQPVKLNWNSIQPENSDDPDFGQFKALCESFQKQNKAYQEVFDDLLLKEIFKNETFSQKKQGEYIISYFTNKLKCLIVKISMLKSYALDQHFESNLTELIKIEADLEWCLFVINFLPVILNIIIRVYEAKNMQIKQIQQTLQQSKLTQSVYDGLGLSLSKKQSESLLMEQDLDKQNNNSIQKAADSHSKREFDMLSQSQTYRQRNNTKQNFRLNKSKESDNEENRIVNDFLIFKEDLKDDLTIFILKLCKEIQNPSNLGYQSNVWQEKFRIQIKNIYEQTKKYLSEKQEMEIISNWGGNNPEMRIQNPFLTIQSSQKQSLHQSFESALSILPNKLQLMYDNFKIIHVELLNTFWQVIDTSLLIVEPLITFKDEILSPKILLKPLELPLEDFANSIIPNFIRTTNKGGDFLQKTVMAYFSEDTKNNTAGRSFLIDDFYLKLKPVFLKYEYLKIDQNKYAKQQLQRRVQTLSCLIQQRFISSLSPNSQHQCKSVVSKYIHNMLREHSDFKTTEVELVIYFLYNLYSSDLNTFPVKDFLKPNMLLTLMDQKVGGQAPNGSDQSRHQQIYQSVLVSSSNDKTQSENDNSSEFTDENGYKRKEISKIAQICKSLETNQLKQSGQHQQQLIFYFQAQSQELLQSFQDFQFNKAKCLFEGSLDLFNTNKDIQLIVVDEHLSKLQENLKFYFSQRLPDLKRLLKQVISFLMKRSFQKEPFIQTKRTNNICQIVAKTVSEIVLQQKEYFQENQGEIIPQKIIQYLQEIIVGLKMTILNQIQQNCYSLQDKKGSYYNYYEQLLDQLQDSENQIFSHFKESYCLFGISKNNISKIIQKQINYVQELISHKGNNEQVNKQALHLLFQSVSRSVFRCEWLYFRNYQEFSLDAFNFQIQTINIFFIHGCPDKPNEQWLELFTQQTTNFVRFLKEQLQKRPKYSADKFVSGYQTWIDEIEDYIRLLRLDIELQLTENQILGQDTLNVLNRFVNYYSLIQKLFQHELIDTLKLHKDFYFKILEKLNEHIKTFYDKIDQVKNQGKEEGDKEYTFDDWPKNYYFSTEYDHQSNYDHEQNSQVKNIFKSCQVFFLLKLDELEHKYQNINQKSYKSNQLQDRISTFTMLQEEGFFDDAFQFISSTKEDFLDPNLSNKITVSRINPTDLTLTAQRTQLENLLKKYRLCEQKWPQKDVFDYFLFPNLDKMLSKNQQVKERQWVVAFPLGSYEKTRDILLILMGHQIDQPGKNEPYKQLQKGSRKLLILGNAQIKSYKLEADRYKLPTEKYFANKASQKNDLYRKSANKKYFYLEPQSQEEQEKEQKLQQGYNKMRIDIFSVENTFPTFTFMQPIKLEQQKIIYYIQYLQQLNEKPIFEKIEPLLIEEEFKNRQFINASQAALKSVLHAPVSGEILETIKWFFPLDNQQTFKKFEPELKEAYKNYFDFINRSCELLQQLLWRYVQAVRVCPDVDVDPFFRDTFQFKISSTQDYLETIHEVYFKELRQVGL